MLHTIMNYTKKFLAAFLEPFQAGKGFNITLLSIFAAINGLVLFNAIFHNAWVGYDAHEYINYISILSELRLVTPEDSYEFFSPPLPFVIPALSMIIAGVDMYRAAKLAQMLNVLLSFGSTFYLIKLCQVVGPQSTLKQSALILLALLPVYYKTFAFVRGEPYVVFFSIIMLYYALLMVIKEQFTWVNSILMGIAMGFIALSRQWGIFLFPAVFILFAYKWIRSPPWRSSIIRAFILCIVLIAVISGWFYLSLIVRYGSGTPFNRQPAEQFSLQNQPEEFYTGISPEYLFSNPVRPNFANQFIPIFYSEVWGDYWCYFTVYARDTRTSQLVIGPDLSRIFSQERLPTWLATNYETASNYLGRVNRVSLFPTSIILISLIYALWRTLPVYGHDPAGVDHRIVSAFFLLAIGITMTGYIWFLIMYPYHGRGDTIKATYMIQIFPLTAVLGGMFLETVKKRSQVIYRIIIAFLFLSIVHNLPAMITHY